ncbi:hypothetical protein [Peribacillus sp. TH14]|uniref:hypothetical protein n=1 Tax=Peribacillus sp. TH14 TaxID=2798481 RepID=UPI0019116C59|nr:hypothetical protein [Peribacillus sp. TH14]MBK5502237.1 hypothetical protein [Peribacillus sp. TH14]
MLPPLMNKSEETVILESKKFFQECSPIIKSPIDNFYEICTKYVKLTKPEIVGEYPDITRLLIMGYVSAVEEYLRNVFCYVINICPQARDKASDKMIKFGSVDYYDLSKIAEGLFDASSFASGKEIKSKTRELLDIDIKENSSLDVAMKEFNKICHLRHCAVHSGGILNGHNAKELGLSRDDVKSVLKPDLIAVQEALLVCYSFVRAFNQHVFEKTLERWKNKLSLITGNWAAENELFTKFVNIFWSTTDNGEIANYKKIFRKVMPIVAAKEVYPDDTAHHRTIKEIFENHRELSEIPTYINKFYELTFDEIETVIEKILYYDKEDAEQILQLLTQNHPNVTDKLKIIAYIFENPIEVRDLERNVIAMFDDLTEDLDIYEAIRILIEHCKYKFHHVYGKLFKVSDTELIDRLISIFGSISNKIDSEIDNETLAEKVTSCCQIEGTKDFELHFYEVKLVNTDIQIKANVEAEVEEKDDKISLELDILLDKDFNLTLSNVRQLQTN